MALRMVLRLAMMTTVPLLGSVAASPGQEGAAEELLLEWRFDGDLADASGHGHAGAAVGEHTFAEGPEGQALALDGTGGYIAADTALPELSEAFTVECWVRPEAVQRPYADILGNHENDFAGFALQQDGEQANRYYFTYGTGSAWVYSHTVPLAAETWQHVAAVKSADRLRVYISGLLVDTVAAHEPMAPSQTPFMVGLGIAGQPRWFAGRIAGVRVWQGARRPSVQPSAEEALRVFLATGRVEAGSSSRWGLFRPSRRNQVTFSLDPEAVPAGLDAVEVAFECRDAQGRLVHFSPPVQLSRADDFRATVPLPPTPGLFRVTCTPSVSPEGKRLPLAETPFTYLVLHPADRQAEALPSVPVAGEAPRTLSSAVSLDGEWQIATDPQNQGLAAGWRAARAPETQATRVPWIIQDAFPGYHGVAWYWREFEAPANPHRGGRYVLRFGAVDYKAEVWVNGRPVGGHEGGETPFDLDVTDAIRAGQTNRVAVRVLNPTHESIDGMTLRQTPHRAKVIPYSAGASYNHGGIVESVELAVVPRVYLTDLYLRPDPQTGRIDVEATVRNAGRRAVRPYVTFTVAPASGGQTIDARTARPDLPPGEGVVAATLTVPEPHLWDLSDPFLYRVTVEVRLGASADERSDRCGFRDFRFEHGYFRLNGRRVFLRGAHTVNATPVGQQVPGDPELFQRDLLYMKTMGFNCLRFIWGGATRRQLDMCDEVGLLVYDEHSASNPFEVTPQAAERFDRSVAETIRRDRNHPSVVIWGLLNETPEGPFFRHAAGVLPLVRSLDETRVVMLNSGRWDGQLDIGSIANPGGLGWDTYLGGEGPGGGTTGWGGVGGYIAGVGDVHMYPRVPHAADSLERLRRLGEGAGPVLLTEYGIGSAVDLWRLTRRFEQLGKPEAEDAVFYQERLDRFLADWERWRLGECFAGPEAFFSDSLRKMAGQRTLGLEAIRANPSLVGYSLTGMMDHVNCGEGLFTLFRELKPGTTDALFEGLAPLRLCLFAEPPSLYRGGEVKLEAVLANEDALGPGDYPVRLQVIGPDMARPLDTTVTVTVPKGAPGHEPPLAIPFFSESVRIDGPGGRYRFRATMERGGAPTGGETVFHVADASAMPSIAGEVTLVGDDPALREWLAARGMRAREAAPEEGGVILVAGSLGEEAAWQDLERRVRGGATAVFLSPEVFRRGDDPTAWLPLAERGTLKPIVGWLYLKDEWAKTHPVFDGLPTGGLMDYTVYRDIIPDLVFAGQEPPSEAIAGAIKASQDYDSGLTVAVYRVGAGRLLLNTLRIRENLSANPVAERLLRNMLRWARASG